MIFDSLGLIANHQIRLDERLVEQAKNVASVLDASNKLHVFHRQNIQSVANDLALLKEDFYVSANDSVVGSDVSVQ